MIHWKLPDPKLTQSHNSPLAATRWPCKRSGFAIFQIRWGRTLRCTDRKSTRLNSSHLVISYAVFCLKKNNLNHHAEELVHHLFPGHLPVIHGLVGIFIFFFFNDTGTTKIYTLSLPGALPI